MNRQPLDTFDEIPREMRAYLRNNGWHFNKKACEYATKQMRKKSTATAKPEKIDPWTKEEVEQLLQRNNVTLDNNTGHDFVFVANMAKADYLGSSIADEQHLALYIKDSIDDIDAGDGTIMRRWYASMVAAGIPVEWDEIL